MGVTANQMRVVDVRVGGRFGRANSDPSIGVALDYTVPREDWRIRLLDAAQSLAGQSPWNARFEADDPDAPFRLWLSRRFYTSKSGATPPPFNTLLDEAMSRAAGIVSTLDPLPEKFESALDLARDVGLEIHYEAGYAGYAEFGIEGLIRNKWHSVTYLTLVQGISRQDLEKIRDDLQRVKETLPKAQAEYRESREQQEARKRAFIGKRAAETRARNKVWDAVVDEALKWRAEHGVRIPASWTTPTEYRPVPPLALVRSYRNEGAVHAAERGHTLCPRSPDLTGFGIVPPDTLLTCADCLLALIERGSIR